MKGRKKKRGTKVLLDKMSERWHGRLEVKRKKIKKIKRML